MTTDYEHSRNFVTHPEASAGEELLDAAHVDLRLLQFLVRVWLRWPTAIAGRVVRETRDCGPVCVLHRELSWLQRRHLLSLASGICSGRHGNSCCGPDWNGATHWRLNYWWRRRSVVQDSRMESGQMLILVLILVLVLLRQHHVMFCCSFDNEHEDWDDKVEKMDAGAKLTARIILWHWKWSKLCR